jgi:hypothetical protein
MNIDEMKAEKELAEKQIQIAVENAVERFRQKTGLVPNQINVGIHCACDIAGIYWIAGIDVKLNVQL